MSLVELTQSDNGRRMSAEVGDKICIRLFENATTGYQWALTSYSEDHLSSEGPDGSDAPSDEPLGAGGSDAVFCFKATSEGEATITLIHARGYEDKDDPRLYRYTVTIDIAP